MKKGLVIVLALMILASGVSGIEVPSVDFDDLKCSNLGVLSFRANYEWNGYKGGYVYLPSVKISEKGIGVKGFWYKFENKEYSISEIKLNAPTAYFFSNKDSLKEGTHEIIIDYAVSRNNYERFKNQFIGNVSCPKQKEVTKSVEKVEIIEKVVEEEGEPVVVPIKEPPLIDKNAKGYVNYYVIGLLMVIFVISTFVAEKFYKKHSVAKKKPSPRNVKNLFERKV